MTGASQGIGAGIARTFHRAGGRAAIGWLVLGRQGPQTVVENQAVKIVDPTLERAKIKTVMLLC